MNELIKARIFVDTGSYQREKEDLTYCTFKDLNFVESRRHISFFRSDFRGSNFFNVNFFRNNFDRADLISCNIRNCSFDSVDFGNCEIKNCYFEDIVFKNNKYDGTAIQQSTFVNCHFHDEQFLFTMYECNFIDCSFSTCRFEKSSTEKLEFLRCRIIDTDLATMHAEWYTFISCDLKNVCIGNNYVFGYLLYDTNIEEVDFLYHGEKIHYNTLESPYKKLWEEERYFEFINAYIMYKNLVGISDIIVKSIERLCSVEVVQFRKTELNNILEAVCFYIKYSKLPYVELVKTLDYLDQFNWQQFSLEETLNCLSKIEKVKHIMSVGGYQLSNNFINTIPNDEFALVTMQYDTDNYEEALSTSEKLLKYLFNIQKLPDAYCLVDQKCGSWELTFFVFAIFAITIPRYIKNINDISIDFILKRKLSKTLLAKINDNTKIKELKSIAEIANSGHILIPTEQEDMKPKLSEISKVVDFLKSIKISI